jgi:hypothetical protein
MMLTSPEAKIFTKQIGKVRIDVLAIAGGRIFDRKPGSSRQLTTTW